jgi:hypothetical protein
MLFFDKILIKKDYQQALEVFEVLLMILEKLQNLL